MPSLCGLNCSDCPCYLALKSNNEELRQKTVNKWAKEYGWKDLKASDINCAGCLVFDGPHFKNCAVCGVRQCGLERGMSNCGACIGYDNCQKIQSLHQLIPDGKNTCDEIQEITCRRFIKC